VSRSSPVVTGLGIISAPGRGVAEVWRAVSTNTRGLKPLSLFESPRHGQLPVGEVSGDLLKLGAPLAGSRGDKLGWLAANDAIASARLDLAQCAARTGIVLGSSVGGSFDSERFLNALIKRGQMRARPTRFHECASTVDLIAGRLGFGGPGVTLATACSSGALAIATAAEMVQAGEADIMLAGGADSLSRMTWGGFHALLLVDPNGCRPFDAARAGMSLGEGAAMLVLESEESARRRGATILARLTGWGASADAHHATAPHPQGEGAAAAMRSALARARLEPSAIQYVNAHGTGTRDNDLAESRALNAVFAGNVPPFSSTKGIFGHALAASGAIEALVCVEALRRQEMPPNPGFTTPDPAIGLSPLTELRPAPLRHVMSNSFGFGGNNAVLVFSAPDADNDARSAAGRPVVVAGIGVIGPGRITMRQIEPPLPPGEVAVHDCGAPDTALLDANQRRRLCRSVQMALIASRRAQVAEPGRRLSVAIGTGLGFLEDAAAFIETMIGTDERERLPTRFPNSVHNAAAGQVSIALQARGLNSAPTCGEISFEAALWQAVRQLATGEADRALAGSVDELNKYPLAIGKRWGAWNDTLRPGEGAAIASLAPAGEIAAPLARVTAVKLGRWTKPFDAEREADWIASAVNLASLDAVLSGAKGWPALDLFYEDTVAALSRRAGRALEHQTYKPLCGEFHSASAFGFSVAVEEARRRGRGVLLYTLALRGGKALCLIEP
jgi:3-oxoacyl-(acyl-carrier-protein) synthase